MARERVSIVMDREALAWARARAKTEGRTVSEVVNDAIRRARQAEAWSEYLAWALDGREPPSPAELEVVERGSGPAFGRPSPP